MKKKMELPRTNRNSLGSKRSRQKRAPPLQIYIFVYKTEGGLMKSKPPLDELPDDDLPNKK